MNRMPVVFSGHGSPMLALEDTEVTRGLRSVGEEITAKHGKPKGILAVSAHWYTRGSFLQREEKPRQVYDMYGFPDELYAFRYPAEGSPELADAAAELLREASGVPEVTVDNSWGIDHGTWTVLCHMFPEADVPVAQLSVDASASPRELYDIGRALAPLRDAGYLIFASGNVVHNLRRVEWDNPGGSPETISFNSAVIRKVQARDDAGLMDYAGIPHADYAVPTPEHYLPLLYALGAAEGEAPRLFNDQSEMAAISMTGFAFGL